MPKGHFLINDVNMQAVPKWRDLFANLAASEVYDSVVEGPRQHHRPPLPSQALAFDETLGVTQCREGLKAIPRSQQLVHRTLLRSSW